MEVTAIAAAGMAGAARKNGQGGKDRVIGRDEIIERMASALRLKSGLDLPQAYFVEQVKLQLAGSPAFDRSLLGPGEERADRQASLGSADCFRAWAIPE